MIKPYPLNIELCVLIPCYNNFTGLIQSVNSIVYDKEKLLVLIVDDGSKEPLDSTTLQNSLHDGMHFSIIQNEENQGITASLNNGLEFIYSNLSVEFIARLDCGDICSPDRFYKQVSFLKDNASVDLLGTWCYFKDVNSGTGYSYITPTRHKQIKRTMHFRNVFIHPTVMWRFSSNQRFKYPEQFPHAEDYGLFYNMVSEKKSAILNEFLVTCEINPAGISASNRAVQLRSRLKVILHYGKNKFYLLLGAVKLLLLMKVPYELVFMTKKKIFKVQ